MLTDDALGDNQFFLFGTDAAMFQVVGTELFLMPGAVLDFESKPLLNVSVGVVDILPGASSGHSAAFQLQVTDSNEAPTIALSNQTVSLPENTSLTTAITVAEIVVTDDAPGNNQLQLAGPDAALFQIVGNELQLVAGATLDFENQPLLSVTVDVEDPTLAAGINDSVTYGLLITDSNEPPTVTLSSTLVQIPESTVVSLPLKVADILVADDAVGSNQLSLSGTDAAMFQIVGTELFLMQGAELDFESLPQLDVNAVSYTHLTLPTKA